MTPPLRLSDPAGVALYTLELNAAAEALFDTAAHPWEKARAAQIQHVEARRRFRASHGAMRGALAAYRHCTPAALKISAAAAPQVVGGPFISLSRAGDHAVLLCSDSGPVGVDLVALDPLAPPIDAHFVTLADCAVLARYLSEPRVDLGVWAAKEAAAKLLNLVELPPDAWCITAAGDRISVVTGEHRANVHFIRLPHSLLAAIAVLPHKSG